MKKANILLTLIIIIGLYILLIRQNQITLSKNQGSGAKTEEVISSEINEGIILEIISPINQSIVNTASVTVKGKTAPNADVFINEKELKADGSGNFSSVMTLEEGDNYIIVAANDTEGNYAEKEIVVTYMVVNNL